MEFVVPVSKVEVCRDPDDDKFLACALDAGAYYVVSSDADLLVIENFENIEIITAKDFWISNSVKNANCIKMWNFR